MGSIGTTEIIVIIIVAFLIFGPDKFPQMIKKVARFFQEFRNIKGELLDSFNEVKDTISEAAEDTRKDLDLTDETKDNKANAQEK